MAIIGISSIAYYCLQIKTLTTINSGKDAQSEQDTMIEMLTRAFTNANVIDIRAIAHVAVTPVSGPWHMLPQQKSQHKQ
jgi:hypothetical protein